jgi:hypothetical protein
VWRIEATNAMCSLPLTTGEFGAQLRIAVSKQQTIDTMPVWRVQGAHSMKLLKSIVLASVFGLSAVAANAATLDDVKAKGFVQCGSNPGLTGFGVPDDQGNWTGFDVDFYGPAIRCH